MTDFVVGFARCNEPSAILLETLAAIEASSRRPDHIIVIDNGDEPLPDPVAKRIDPGVIMRPMRNVGCAGAWNLIYDLADVDVDRVIILNADCAPAPTTFERMLAVPAPAVVLGYAFGCFLIDQEIRQRVGLFDAEFYPAYFEDGDYRRRMALAGVTPIEWPLTPATDAGMGRQRSPEGIVHGSYDPDGYQGWRENKLGWFWECYEKNHQRYLAKWGGEPGHETFGSPFNADLGAPSR